MRDFAVMMVRALRMLGCLVVLGAAHGARAQQFVLLDATFTAAANNTMSSEYAVAPLAGAPVNWRAPIDYASGSLHVRVQVLEKPSDAKTLCNVCFKAAELLTCMPYPSPYTKPGVYESEPKFSSFWQYEVYDWTKAVERVNVVVKDENGRFVQGDPAFFPTKLHVTVTVIPPGERFAGPLAGDDADAGVGPLPGEPGAPARGPASNPSASGAAGAAAANAGAGAGTGTLAAGHAAPFVPLPNMERNIRDYVDPGSSCAVLHMRPKARYGVSVSLGVVGICLWQIARMRRRKCRHVGRARSHGRRAQLPRQLNTE